MSTESITSPVSETDKETIARRVRAAVDLLNESIVEARAADLEVVVIAPYLGGRASGHGDVTVSICQRIDY